MMIIPSWIKAFFIEFQIENYAHLYLVLTKLQAMVLLQFSMLLLKLLALLLLCIRTVGRCIHMDTGT